MNKFDTAKILKDVRMFTSKHSPEILTGIGVAGMISTTVLAVKATPKALKLIEAKKQENYSEGEKMPPIEVVKTCWKCYVPAAITGLTSIACIAGASSVHVKRNAALATAYKLSETALIEYRDKVIETVGEKKEEVIRHAVKDDHVKNKPVTKSEVIVTGQGKTLCYDHLSGRYFESDIDEIKKAVIELNFRLLDEMYVSLNDLYDELGLEHSVLGDELGWNIDICKRIDVDFSSHIADDGRPCIVVDYSVAPRYDYSSFV